MTHSVAVIGAGPTGLMLAHELARAEVDVVVLDAETGTATGPNLRSTMLHARAEELLELRGLMSPLRVPEPPLWPVIHFANFWLDLEPLIEHDYSLAIAQQRTVEVIESRARELGAQIRRGHRLLSLRQDPDGVVAEVEGPEGRYELAADYLVGCDGEHSAVRGLAGFEVTDEGTGWHGLMADFAELRASLQSPTYPGGIFAVGPNVAKEGWLRLMTMEFGDPPQSADTSVTTADLSAASVRITGEEREFPEPTWSYRYQGTTQHVAAYRDGRVLLAGDAAHVHYFGAGHGASTGMHDAVNLGWKLAAQIKGWAPEGLLDSYHEERHAVGKRVVMSTEAQLRLQHPADKVGPLRELFGELVEFEEVNRLLVQIITEVCYPMGRAADDPRHPLLGRPAPQVELKTAAGAQPLAEALRGGRGLLLDLSDGTAAETAAGWAGRVDVLAAQPAAELDATALLVRPDGFVAWADRDGTDAAGLREALGTWFGAPVAR